MKNNLLSYLTTDHAEGFNILKQINHCRAIVFLSGTASSQEKSGSVTQSGLHVILCRTFTTLKPGKKRFHQIDVGVT